MQDFRRKNRGEDSEMVEKRRVLIISGRFSGNFSARELKKRFRVTVVDAKESFEYAPGVLRACVKPAHLDAYPLLEK